MYREKKRLIYHFKAFSSQILCRINLDFTETSYNTSVSNTLSTVNINIDANIETYITTWRLDISRNMIQEKSIHLNMELPTQPERSIFIRRNVLF